MSEEARGRRTFRCGGSRGSAGGAAGPSCVTPWSAFEYDRRGAQQLKRVVCQLAARAPSTAASTNRRGHAQVLAGSSSEFFVVSAEQQTACQSVVGNDAPKSHPFAAALVMLKNGLELVGIPAQGAKQVSWFIAGQPEQRCLSIQQTSSALAVTRYAVSCALSALMQPSNWLC